VNKKMLLKELYQTTQGQLCPKSWTRSKAPPPIKLIGNSVAPGGGTASSHRVFRMTVPGSSKALPTYAPTQVAWIKVDADNFRLATTPRAASRFWPTQATDTLTDDENCFTLTRRGVERTIAAVIRVESCNGRKT
jgi:hypothetical protein